MKTDEYSEVVNDPETYKEIAHNLKLGYPVFIGWTDGHLSHFDILFTNGASGYGTHQGGVRPTDLFVSIMRVGSFGFEINNEDTHHGYYGEKLNMGENVTTEALAELINGIKKELNA